MANNIELLLEAQELEQRIRQLETEVAGLPKRLAALDQRLAGTRQAGERIQAAQTANQGEKRQVERQIESLQEKIVKIKGHSAEVKTNQEYRALLDEIAFAESEISRHEERLLQVMEDSDRLAGEAKAQAAELAGQMAEVQKERERIEALTEADRKELATLRERAGRLRAAADQDWVTRFERVMKTRGSALAAIERDACGSCHVRLRPQFLQEVSGQPERLFVCESCGRILYIARQPAAAQG